MKPIVATVGRPNVGKSMLFNKLIGRRLSIVEDTPGVTRDRIYGETDWNGRKFTLIDTGGIEPRTDNQILEFMRDQAQIAIENATVIVFLTDIKTGLTASDHEVASMLLRSGKPIVLAVNKMDSTGAPDPDFYEFYNLGLGDPIAVSAVHGHGTGDLLDACVQYFPPEDEEEEEDDAIKVAVIGKPNAGKSSLVNKILGENRVIVSDVAGTTRDSVDVRFERDGQDYVFVDTAGVRRRTKITDIVEKYSVNAALKSTTKADVTLLTLDATEGVSQQDKRLMDLLDTRKIPFMVLVNKCDLVPAGQLKQLLQNVSEMLAFCKHVPILTVSALKGTGLNKILPMARKIHEECAIRVPTGQLNRAMEEVLTRHQPPVVKRVRAKFFYLTQAESQPPTFVFFVSDADRVPESYARYLERALRRIFGITHAPMRLHLRSSHKKSQ